MRTLDILHKLRTELEAGIETEPQVVYLLASIRKLIEQDAVQDKYPDLKFHCDWVLHPKLEGTAARQVLREFDAAHPHLKADMNIRDLPNGLGKKIIRLSGMQSFESQLERFLDEYGLPSLRQKRPDGWAHFLHLYTKVIEDIPLQVALPTPKKKGPRRPVTSAPKHISGVTVHYIEAPAPLEQGDDAAEILYQVRWTIHDKNGNRGSVFVLNSYTRPA